MTRYRYLIVGFFLTLCLGAAASIIGDQPSLPLEDNGGVPVNLQDQTTPPIDALFAQSVAGADFTLASDTGVSGVEAASFVYNFVATAGHNIIAGEEVILLDIDDNKSFYAEVAGVLGDIITVDRPIDHDFDAVNTLGREVITNMAVDGSITPQVFSIRAGTNPIDITRIILQITDETSMDDAKFGGMPPLARGLVLRIVDSFNKTIFNWKTNGEIQQYCFDLSYSSKAPAGFFGMSARVTFAGQSKHGIVLRISNLDVIQIVVQDDLRPLVTARVVAQGHEVTQDVGDPTPVITTCSSAGWTKVATNVKNGMVHIQGINQNYDTAYFTFVSTGDPAPVLAPGESGNKSVVITSQSTPIRSRYPVDVYVYPSGEEIEVVTSASE